MWADLERYSANEQGKFQCFDGSAVLDLNVINDDYCDCADGSDEPGGSLSLPPLFHPNCLFSSGKDLWNTKKKTKKNVFLLLYSVLH